MGTPPQFGAQESEVRGLRQQAFAGDFFAQIDLAGRYDGRPSRERNLEDPVEAAVWYELALANRDGYAPITAYQDFEPSQDDGRPQDCRVAERTNAEALLGRLLSRMSSEERAAVHDRVVYVLSTQGAEGFRTLARLHDRNFGPFGNPIRPAPLSAPWQLFGPPEPPLHQGPSAPALFVVNDIDVYLFNYLAAQSGDVAGYVSLRDFQGASQDRGGLAADAEAKAKRWSPPFEFYPPDAPGSGVPHSDESAPHGEVFSNALARLHDLPFVHIGHALAYLHVTPRAPRHERELTVGEVRTFQVMLGRPMSSRLTPLEKVRAIQYAAVNGSPKAQLTLAVMYAEGIGVVRDYARAFHWFAEADRQGSPEAKYAMSTYFSLGVTGVADQDKAAAVVYQIDGALAGFRPSAQRLRDVLAQVGRPPRSHDARSSARSYR